uniref:Uncharacterized protein n=1 Tax=Bos indicus x Bos taurus TaxID=30522 RepID=A0A4W2GT39_BOBOX
MRKCRTKRNFYHRIMKTLLLGAVRSASEMLNILTLNATEPIGCLQWSTTTAAAPRAATGHLPDQAQGLAAH